MTDAKQRHTSTPITDAQYQSPFVLEIVHKTTFHPDIATHYISDNVTYTYSLLRSRDAFDSFGIYYS